MSEGRAIPLSCDSDLSAWVDRRTILVFGIPFPPVLLKSTP